MKINLMYEIAFWKNENYFTSKFYINRDLFQFGFESKENTLYKYWINGVPQKKNVWQNHFSERTNENLNIIEENLIEFWEKNKSIEFEEIIEDISIHFNFFEDENNQKHGNLDFKLNDNHMVGLNNYFQMTNFQSKELSGAFDKILKKITNTITSDKSWNLITQDVVVFEEFMEISSKESTYFGFVDKEPFTKPISLFKISTNKLIRMIELFIRFIEINKIEK
ncbi:MAG: hypothetical protein MRY83_01180 [Flavobacteriales bacterium]|nr:hypothetical protein [Flavobacteriales bacterium]